MIAKIITSVILIAIFGPLDILILTKAMLNHTHVYPFSKGKEVTGTGSNTLISDGSRNVKTAFNKELYTNKWPRARHISHIRLQGDHNNNKIERLNGTIRDREKTMRSLKKANTPILKGMQIYHNFIREHQGLEEKKTPAEKAGIQIDGDNKWLTIIQNASSNEINL